MDPRYDVKGKGRALDKDYQLSDGDEHSEDSGHGQQNNDAPGDLLDEICHDDIPFTQQRANEEQEPSHIRDRDNWAMKHGAMTHEDTEQ